MKNKFINIFNETNNVGAFCLLLKNKQNKIYLDFLLCETKDIDKYNPSISLRLYYVINNINIPMLCNCGKHLSYIGFGYGFRKTCGNKSCYVLSRRKTSLEKYGVDNPMKLKSTQNKVKETIKNNFGEEGFKNPLIRNKFKKTMMENHGVEWAQQNKDIQAKTKKTNEEKSDVEKLKDFESRSNAQKKSYATNGTEILLSRKQTIIDEYGSLENYYKEIGRIISKAILESPNKELGIEKRISSYENTITEKIKNRLPTNISYVNRFYNENNTDYILTLKCDTCYEIFDIHRGILAKRIEENDVVCLICNPIVHGFSKAEKDLLNYIQSIYTGEIIENYKLQNQEIDIYIPDMKLGIEYNGLYWHSEEYKDKNFHINKSKFFNENGILIINVWEDHWLNKKEIIKSRFLNIFNKSEKIYARNCKIKFIEDVELVKNFLDKNHIQGHIGSSHKIGLFYNNELISLMTFGHLRINLGQKSENDTYEMLRFCSKLNFVIVGGASKLFSFFKKQIKPTKIVSYSDNNFSEGGIYKTLGFIKEGNSKPNYYWIERDSDHYYKRHNRFSFRKDVLVKEGFDKNKTEVEIMHERGYLRLFDCGSQRWIYSETT